MAEPFVMSPNGKVVSCNNGNLKAKIEPSDQPRAVCLAMVKEDCPRCPNSRFLIKIQVNVGHQEVACPRWPDESERLKGKAPSEYVPIRRELCLRVRPFFYCASCKNSNPANPPESVEGWVERHKRGG